MKASERCTATVKRTGERCRRWPIRGASVCDSHGAGTKAARRKAAERVALAKAEGMLAKYAIEPVTDPLGKLLEVAGRFDQLARALEQKVDELKNIRYSTKAGEQLRAEIAAYSTVLDRLRQTLTDIGRLDVDARLAKIEEAKLILLAGAFEAAVERAGLDELQVLRLRSEFARELEAVSD